MGSKTPVLRFQIGSTVVPGDRLGTIRQVVPGKGTYVRGGHIYACFVGRMRVSPIEQQQDGDDAMTDTKAATAPSYTCSVEMMPGKQSAASQALTIGQLVVGKVARITPQNAVLEISVAEHVGTLQTIHEGAIRMEDVRSGASEQVAIEQCFQPGDLVIARVISLGDSRRYFLSTAETELGVIRALKESASSQSLASLASVRFSTK